MNELSTITSKLIDSVKTIDKENINITVMLIDFSSQFDDAHKALYAEAMTLIKAWLDNNLMFVGAWLTTPNPKLNERRPIDVLATAEGAKEVIHIVTWKNSQSPWSRIARIQR